MCVCVCVSRDLILGDTDTIYDSAEQANAHTHLHILSDEEVQIRKAKAVEESHTIKNVCERETERDNARAVDDPYNTTHKVFFNAETHKHPHTRPPVQPLSPQEARDDGVCKDDESLALEDAATRIVEEAIANAVRVVDFGDAYEDEPGELHPAHTFAHKRPIETIDNSNSHNSTHTQLQRKDRHTHTLLHTQAQVERCDETAPDWFDATPDTHTYTHIQQAEIGATTDLFCGGDRTPFATKEVLHTHTHADPTSLRPSTCPAEALRPQDVTHAHTYAHVAGEKELIKPTHTGVLCSKSDGLLQSDESPLPIMPVEAATSKDTRQSLAAASGAVQDELIAGSTEGRVLSPSSSSVILEQELWADTHLTTFTHTQEHARHPVVQKDLKLHACSLRTALTDSCSDTPQQDANSCSNTPRQNYHFQAQAQNVDMLEESRSPPGHVSLLSLRVSTPNHHMTVAAHEALANDRPGDDSDTEIEEPAVTGSCVPDLQNNTQTGTLVRTNDPLSVVRGLVSSLNSSSATAQRPNRHSAHVTGHSDDVTHTHTHKHQAEKLCGNWRISKTDKEDVHNRTHSAASSETAVSSVVSRVSAYRTRHLVVLADEFDGCQAPDWDRIARNAPLPPLRDETRPPSHTTTHTHTNRSPLSIGAKSSSATSCVSSLDSCRRARQKADPNRCGKAVTPHPDVCVSKSLSLLLGNSCRALIRRCSTTKDLKLVQPMMQTLTRTHTEDQIHARQPR